MKKAVTITGAAGSILYFLAGLMIGYKFYHTISLLTSVYSDAELSASASGTGGVLLIGIAGISILAMPVLCVLEMLWNRKKPRLGNGFALCFFGWALLNLVLYRMVPPQSYVVVEYMMLMSSPLKDVAFFQTVRLSELLLLAGSVLVITSCVLTALDNKRAAREDQESRRKFSELVITNYEWGLGEAAYA